MKNSFRILFCVLFILSAGYETVVAASDSLPFEIKTFEEATAPSEASIPDENDERKFRFLQENNKLFLIFAVMGVTPVFLLIILYFISRSGVYTAENIVNGSGLVLVIQATLLIVIAAPTTEQLTAAIGVIGAIAGYLFGSAKLSSRSPAEKKES
ncbi:MAG: hypothetical protein ABIK68_04380 [bacterium]